MRFSDFFLEYKVKVSSIKSTIRWREIDTYKKVGLIVAIVFTFLGLFFYLRNNDNDWLCYICYSISAIDIATLLCLAERKKEIKKMLKKYYKPYSKKRLKALKKLLKKYGIDYNDEKKINMLIDQADVTKSEYCVWKTMKHPVSVVVMHVVIPVAVGQISRGITNMDIDSLIIRGIQLLLWIIVLFAIITPFFILIQAFFRGDAGKYDELKYDLQQIMIFGDKLK